MWIGQTESRGAAELSWRQDVKRLGIRGWGNDRNTAPEYFGLMAAHTGRCECATAEKAAAVPEHVDPPSLADQSGASS
jgi:hypothetical protein